jgi:hypothetical protein
MNALQHARFWLLTMLVILLVMPALIPGDSVLDRLRRESDAIVDLFGPGYGGAVVRSANAIYRTAFVETGLETMVAAGNTAVREQRRVDPVAHAGQQAGRFFNGYLYSALVHAYGVIQRGVLGCFWLVILAPLLLAVVVDGVTIRRIKVATFGSFSPTLYSAGTHAVVLAIFLPLLYMTFPTYVSPWFLPLFALGAAIPLSLAVANAARMA